MKQQIKEIIASNFGVEANEITDDMNLFEEEVLDSFGFVVLSVALSEAFGVELDTSEITREQIQSVNCICNIVKEKQEIA